MACASVALTAFVTATLVTALRAHADERPVRARLDWRAPAGCLSRAELEREVSARLDRRVFVTSEAPDVLVQGSIRAETRGWIAQLQMRRRDGAQLGNRTLRVADGACDGLDEPLALVLALLIDLPRSDVRLRIAPRPEPGEDWTVSVQIGATVTAGLVPSLAPGARLVIGVEPPRLPRLEMSGVLLASARSVSENGAVEVSARRAGLVLCTPAGSLGRLWLRGCTGADLVSLRGRGVGFDRNHEHDRAMVAATVRAKLGVRLVGPLALNVDADLDVPLARPRFYATLGDRGQVDLHRPAAVLFTMSLGVSLTLPL